MLITMSLKKLITCVTPSGGERSIHMTWHALHQGPHPSWSNCRPHQGLALLTLSWDKNWDSRSLLNGYPSFCPRIALVAPSPGGQHAAILVQWKSGQPRLRSRPHLAQKMLNGVHACDTSWPFHDLHILLYQESSCVV